MGFLLGQSEKQPGVVVEISADGGPHGQVKPSQLPDQTIQIRHWPIHTSYANTLRVIVVERMINIYIDDVLVINYGIPTFEAGVISLTAREGKAYCKDIRYYALRP